MGKRFFQEANIVSAFVPVDLQTAANTGDWVSMVNYNRVVAVLFKGIGTAGQDPVFTLEQATDASGTAHKALTFTTIYQKVGTQTGIAAFTETTQAAATSYTNAASAEAESIIAVEINAADLDVDGGFTHVQLSVADVGGNAQLGCGFYIMLEEWLRLELFDDVVAFRVRQTEALERATAQALQRWTETSDIRYLAEARKLLVDIRRMWGVDKPPQAESKDARVEGLERVAGQDRVVALRLQAARLLEVADELSGRPSTISESP